MSHLSFCITSKDIRKHLSVLFIKYDCYRHIPVFNRLNRVQTTDVTANVCTDIKKNVSLYIHGLKNKPLIENNEMTR